MLNLKAFTLIALISASSAFAQGDTLEMGGSDPGSFESAGKPTRGMTQQQVRNRFGSPENEVAAVGEPPISRWNYAGFVVFFEYDRVIHSVTTR
jgi:hypothetical protein